MKKWLNSALSILLVVLLVVPATAAQPAHTGAGSNIDLSVKVIGKTSPDQYTDEGVPIYRYLSGAKIEARVTFNVSGSAVDIPFGSLHVSIGDPDDSLRQYIENVRFGESVSARRHVWEPNESKPYSVRYEFKSLKGGNVGSYPLSFNFKNLRTPNDTRVPLTLQVLDQEGNIFAHKKIVVYFEAEAKSEYDGAKYVIGYHGETKRFERLVNTYDEATPKEDATPADPAATRTVFHHVLAALPQPNAIAGQGEFADGEYTLEEHLPEGAVFLENDSLNAGWTLKEGENGVYIKNVRLNELTAHNNRFTIPIAVGFPNLPYSQQEGTTYRTELQTNRTVFYQKTKNGLEKIKEDTASVRFQTHPTPEPVLPTGHLFSDLRANIGREAETHHRAQAPLRVTPARNPDEVLVSWTPERNNASKAQQVLPEKGEADQPVLGWTVDLGQNQRPEKTVKDRTGQPKVQPGEDHTDYVRMYTFNIPDLLSDGNVRRLNSGVAFSEFTMDKFVLSSITGYEKESEPLSTAQWINENTTFDIYLTQGSPESDRGGRILSDPTNRASAEKSTLAPPTGAFKVASKVRPGQTVKINDAAGFYNALILVFSDDALNNTNPKGELVHGLPLRNAQTKMHLKVVPIREGATTTLPDGTIHTATAEQDLVKTFNSRLLQHIDAGNLTAAQNVEDKITLGTRMGWVTARDGASVPQTSKEGTLHLYDNHVGYYDGYDGFESHNDRNGSNVYVPADNAFFFRPNLGTFSLVHSSEDHDFGPWRNAEKFRTTTREFEACISPDTAWIPGVSKLKNLKGIVLLPRGVEYVRTHSKGGASAEPQLVTNYRDTGRQAIVYTFGDYSERCTGRVRYDVLINKEAKDRGTGDGRNIVDTWVTWDNNEVFLADARKGAAPDSIDLNTNGNAKDALLHSEANLSLSTSNEALFTMFVSRNGDDWFRNAPFVDIDDNFHYRVQVHNNFVQELKKGIVVGVLPTLGDSTTTADEDGNYHKRGELAYGLSGSTLQTHLSGPIEAHPGNQGLNKAAQRFAFTYLTETDIAREKLQALPENVWKSAADIEAGATTFAEKRAAWAKVTAWRATMKEGESIPGIPDPLPEGFQAGDNIVDIFLNARVENAKERALMMTALTSPTYKVAFGDGELSEGLKDLQEGVEPTVSSVRYVVNGKAFLDWKRTGEVNDAGISGVRARLVYAHDGVDTETGEAYSKGAPVPERWVDVARKGEKGYEVAQANSNTATTDSNGDYAFIVYKRGAYTVEFTRPDDNGTISDKLRFIQCPADAESTTNSNLNKTWTGVDSLERTESSLPVTVSPDQVMYSQDGVAIADEGSLRGIRNAALTDHRQPLIIRKLGLDKDGQATGTLSRTVFSVYKREGDIQGEQVGEDLVTGIDGTVTSQPLLPGDYFLEEKTPAAGYLQPRKVKVTLRPSGQCARMGEFIFANEAGDTEATRDLFSFDVTTGVTTVKNKPRLGTLKVTKLGKGGKFDEKPIVGATFALFRDGKPVMDNTNPALPVPRQAVTDTDGVATFADIAAGTYTVKEISTVEGYAMVDPGVSPGPEDDINLEDVGKVMTIPDDPTLPQTERIINEVVHNKVLLAKIRIVKVDADDTSQLLKGAVFTLKPKDEYAKAAAAAWGEESRMATTGEDGVALFEDVPYGVWTVEETTPPPHYRTLDEAKRVAEVAIRDEGRTYNPYGFGPLKNSIKRADINVKKVNQDNLDEGLSGASFALYSCSGTVDQAGVPTCVESDYSADATPLFRADTDPEGKATFTAVRAGRYALVEMVAPAGFQRDQEAKIVDVALGETEEPVTVTVKNQQIRGTLTAAKVDALSGEALPGAKFKLVRGGQVPPRGHDESEEQYNERVAKHNEPVTLLDGSTAVTTSDEHGLIVFKHIPIGQYRLVEVTPPAGYKRAESVDLSIRDDAFDLSYEKDKKFVIKNEPILTTVQIVKKGGPEGTTPLPGATFELCQADGTVVGSAQTTNADGIAWFRGVRSGTYTLTETKAPAGHQKVKDQTVEVQPPQDSDGSSPSTESADPRAVIVDPTRADASPTGNEAESTPASPAPAVDPAPAVTPTQPLDTHVMKLEVVDPLNVGHVEFTKVAVTSPNDEDLSDNQPLAGATFAIYKAVPNAAGDGWEKNGDAVKTSTSAEGNEQTQPGVVRFADLTSGHYLIEETHTPEGYLPFTGGIHVEIIEHGVVVHPAGYERLGNTLITGNYTFTKKARTSPADDAAVVPIGGATFVLKQNDQVKFTATSSAEEATKGIVTFSQIPYGTYTLEETQAPAGYVAASLSRTVTIEENGVTVRGEDVVNTPITSTVAVTKTADDAHATPLAGAVFELRPTEGGEALVLPLTDDQGKAHVANVPFGHYTLVETTAPTGYRIISQPVEVNVDTNSAKIEKSVTNSKITGTVQVKKVGTTGQADQTQPLSGVVFTLTPQEGTTGPVAEATTNDDGIATFNDVLFGSYTVAEKTAKEGYLLAKDTATVTVTEHGKTVGYNPDNTATTLENFVFTNERIVNDFQCQAKEAGTQRGIAGAKLRLERCVDGTCSGTVDGSAIELTSAEDGAIVASDLAYGTYKLTALSVPEPYLFTDASRVVTVTEAKQAGAEPLTCQEAITFEQARGNVELVLHDHDRPTVPIPTADFELVPVDADGNPLTGDALASFDPNPAQETRYTARTDASGKAVFPKVRQGRYKVVEKQTRAGYVLPTSEELNAQITQLTGDTHIITVGVTQTTNVGTAEAPVLNKPVKSSILTHKVSAACDIAGVKELEFFPDADKARTDFAELVKTCPGLDGAEFTLTPLMPGSAAGVIDSPFIDEGTQARTLTSVNGVLALDEVLYGSYELKETEAPAGFMLNGKVYRVDVLENGGVYVLAPVMNEEEPKISAPLPEPEKPMPEPEQPNTPTPPPALPNPKGGPGKNPAPKVMPPGKNMKGSSLADTGSDTVTLSAFVMMLMTFAAAIFGVRWQMRRGAQHAKRE